MRYAVAAAVVVLQAACSAPCDTLAERVCAKLSASDPACQRVRALATSAGAADQRACAAGNALADDLQKH